MSGKRDSDGKAAACRSPFQMLFHASSHVDHHIIAIALPALNAEILLNDTQLGILPTIAFSLIFAAAVEPLAPSRLYRSHPEQHQGLGTAGLPRFGAAPIHTEALACWSR